MIITEKNEKKFIPRDGKSQFYATLNFDKPTRKLLKWYREIKYLMDRDRFRDFNQIKKVD